MSKAHEALKGSVRAHMHAQGAVAKAAEELARVRAEAAQMRSDEGEAPVQFPAPASSDADSPARDQPAP